MRDATSPEAGEDPVKAVLEAVGDLRGRQGERGVDLGGYEYVSAEHRGAGSARQLPSSGGVGEGHARRSVFATIGTQLRVRADVDDESLCRLHARAFNGPYRLTAWCTRLQRHSLTWIAAHEEDDRLVGATRGHRGRRGRVRVAACGLRRAPGRVLPRHLRFPPHCRRVASPSRSCSSALMLATLRAKVDSSGLDNVEVVQAGFLTYEHSGAPADVVYSRYALHHLPDAWKAIALARIRRMLRPGGLLRLSDVVYHFAPEDAEKRLEAWCATGGDGIVGEWSRAEYEEHVRDEHSTFTWLLEPMIRRAGFTIEDAQYSKDGIFARYLLRAAAGSD